MITFSLIFFLVSITILTPSLFVSSLKSATPSIFLSLISKAIFSIRAVLFIWYGTDLITKSFLSLVPSSTSTSPLSFIEPLPFS